MYFFKHNYLETQIYDVRIVYKLSQIYGTHTTKGVVCVYEGGSG
jgi:hypothetical protein